LFLKFFVKKKRERKFYFFIHLWKTYIAKADFLVGFSTGWKKKEKKKKESIIGHLRITFFR